MIGNLYIYFGLAIVWCAFEFLKLMDVEERREAITEFFAIAWYWRIFVCCVILVFWWMFALNRITVAGIKKIRVEPIGPPSSEE